MHLSPARQGALRPAAIHDIPNLDFMILFFRAFQPESSRFLSSVKSLLHRKGEAAALLFGKYAHFSIHGIVRSLKGKPGESGQQGQNSDNDCDPANPLRPAVLAALHMLRCIHQNHSFREKRSIRKAMIQQNQSRRNFCFITLRIPRGGYEGRGLRIAAAGGGHRLRNDGGREFLGTMDRGLRQVCRRPRSSESLYLVLPYTKSQPSAVGAIWKGRFAGIFKQRPTGAAPYSGE